MQVFAREHSTVPHDVWDKWVELYGETLDAFFPVTDTEIGRIGCLICMEGSYPETSRGLAMNGAEIIYRPSYPQPYVGNGLWEVQNRARALDNTCYMICPNPAMATKIHNIAMFSFRRLGAPSASMSIRRSLLAMDL